jgi:glucan phosphoethanolaminetransferase (alkaline phosphatase superfamily)
MITLKYWVQSSILWIESINWKAVLVTISMAIFAFTFLNGLFFIYFFRELIDLNLILKFGTIWIAVVALSAYGATMKTDK